jgi:biopolymer transport protein ExbB
MLFDFFKKGGFLMYPILFCSILGLSIFLYKFFEYKRIFKELLYGIDFGFMKDGKIEKLSNFSELEIIWTKKIHQIEKGISTLNLLASVSTLLGLTGTVVGMIQTFMVISNIEMPNPSMLASGIWQALITTAFGLFVAIPLHIGVHWLEKEMDEILVILKEKIINKNA